MEGNNKQKCFWCENQATKIDFRRIDGIVSKLISCHDCFEISTGRLLRKLKVGK
jgi:hypothetical protein